MQRSDLNFSHQSELFDPKHVRPVTLFGAGSVGSHVAYLLTKMGVCDLEVWDADNVESHNMPMSLYGPSHLGQPKVEALRELILLLTGTEIKVRRAMYTGEPVKNGSVVACVDTMAARKVVWERLKLNPKVDIFCDTRLAGTLVEVLCVAPGNPKDIKWYEPMLFSDDQATRQTCGSHGIAFAAARAAQIVASNLSQYWEHTERVTRIVEKTECLRTTINTQEQE